MPFNSLNSLRISRDLQRSLPARALGGVFYYDAFCGEHVADFVGAFEVLRLSRFGAFGDERVYLGVFVVRLLLFGQVAEDFVRLVEEGFGFTQAFGVYLVVLGEVDVDGAHHFEDAAEGSRGVEVVVHRLGEALLRRLDGFAQSCVGFAGLAVVEREEHVGAAVVEPFERRLRVVEPLLREVERRAVVYAHEEEAQDERADLLAHVAHREEVAERLRHLLLVDEQVGVVQPVFDELRVVRAFGLRYLVLVVWEDEVAAAAVDVDGLAEVFRRHGAALDVPAGAALAPRALPERLAWFRGLPEREVERALLAFVNLDARAGV